MKTISTDHIKQTFRDGEAIDKALKQAARAAKAVRARTENVGSKSSNPAPLSGKNK